MCDFAPISLDKIKPGDKVIIKEPEYAIVGSIDLKNKQVQLYVDGITVWFPASIIYSSECECCKHKTNHHDLEYD